MNLSNLTPEQAKALASRVTMMRDYVARLSERMDADHFDPNDRVYCAALGARKALEELVAALNDARRPPSPPPKPWEPGGSGRGA